MDMVDGTIFEGQFMDGVKTGHGIYKWPDGSCYEGELKEGLMHG